MSKKQPNEVLDLEYKEAKLKAIPTTRKPSECCMEVQGVSCVLQQRLKLTQLIYTHFSTIRDTNVSQEPRIRPQKVSSRGISSIDFALLIVK